MEAPRRAALITWYDRHGRDLPWRRTSEPWPILVSEVMLQQTQVARVVATWGPFLKRFPTPRSLADATTAEAIGAWGDLGYQRRVLNLRRAAGIIAGQGWPSDPAGLEQLPGVGPYTAAAVGSLAFGCSIPAVDVNHRRVLSRWHGHALDLAEARGLARREIDPVRPAEWNQAMMDLGATLCRPRAPHCDNCPVSRWCRDPSVEVTTKRQSRFAGSTREARAAILKRLATGPPAGVASSELCDLAGDRFTPAVDALIREGTILRSGNHFLLAP